MSLLVGAVKVYAYALGKNPTNNDNGETKIKRVKLHAARPKQ